MHATQSYTRSTSVKRSEVHASVTSLSCIVGLQEVIDMLRVLLE